MTIKARASKQQGAPCPVCGEGKIVNAAVLPIVDDSDVRKPRIIEPHEYGVCVACHREQYKALYGKAPG